MSHKTSGYGRHAILSCQLADGYPTLQL